MKKLIVVNIVVILAILISLELIIRKLDIVSLQGYDPNFFIKENNITFNNPKTSLTVAGKTARIDKFGFRIPIKDFKKNFDESILVLGDSVSFGFGVDEEKSFVGLLRHKLDFNIYNASVIGHNLESYVYVLDKSTKNNSKNVNNILVFLCLNDISISQGVLNQKDLNTINEPKDNFFVRIIKNDFFLKINFLMREKSALFVLIKSFSTNSVKRHYDYMFSKYEKKSLTLNFLNQINNIKKLSEERKIKINFILLPYAYQVINNCNKNFLKPQQTIKNIFSELNLKLNDFTPYFCQNPDKKSLFLAYDPVHLSNIGHQFVNIYLIFLD